MLSPPPQVPLQASPCAAAAPVASGVFSPAAGSPIEQGFQETPLPGQAPTTSSTDPGFADRSNTLPTTGGGSAGGRGKSRLSGVQGGWGSAASEVCAAPPAGCLQGSVCLGSLQCFFKVKGRPHELLEVGGWVSSVQGRWGGGAAEVGSALPARCHQGGQCGSTRCSA